ncbi:NFACT RNA binding domain-containing protein [bacterium]|nr:NFACT RNA binding domain-containing protein [bacterium]
MNHMQIERLLAETGPRVAGGWVRKVWQPDQWHFQLELYAAGLTRFLTVVTTPGACGLYLSDSRLGPAPSEAPQFCDKLRSDLTGKSLVHLEQTPHERILSLDFAAHPGAPLERRLVLELFSAAADCYLLDPEGTVLALLHPGPARKRRNFPGSAFTPAPPGKPGQALEQSDALEELRASRGLPDYNSAVQLALEESAATAVLEQARQEARRAVSRELGRLEALERDFRRKIEAAAQADRLRECGEILAAHFNSLRRGQDRVRLPDFYRHDRMAMRDIELDPALSPRDNLERYFKRARKLTAGAEFAAKQIETIAGRRAPLGAALEKIETLESAEELQAVLAALNLARPSGAKAARKAAQDAPRLPYREFVSADGAAILVGRGGKDNDQLTFRHGHGRDLWLHVAGAAGAHVILRCDKESAFTEEALLDAAHLALFYSDQKEADSADVDYTLCKYVSKPKGLPPGKVNLSQRRTLRLRREKARLDRLLGRDDLAGRA